MSGADDTLPSVHKRGMGVSKGNLQKVRMVESMFAGAEKGDTGGGAGDKKKDPAAAADDAARGRRAQVAHAFDKEKDRLVDKYQKKRNKLESRGIFDSDVNTIRAENMLLSALGKVRMQTLSKTLVREVSEFDTRTGSPLTGGPVDMKPATAREASGAGRGGGTAGRGATSFANRLENELNRRFERDAAAEPSSAKDAEADRRRVGRKHGDRKAVFVGRGRKSSIPGGGAPTDKPASAFPVSPATASIPHGGFETPVAEPLAGPAPQTPVSVAADPADVGLRDTVSLASRDSPHALSDASSPPLDARGGGGGGFGAAGDALASPGARSSRRRQRHIEKEVAFTAAEWLQKQWEHLKYPQVETRLKSRAKRADNQHRPTEYISRYTEPRRWMSGATAQRQDVEGSPRQADTPGPPGSPPGDPNDEDGGGRPAASHRDNAMRQQWERNAAILSVDSMLYSPSLIEVVDGKLVEAAASASDAPNVVPVTTTSTVQHQPPRPEHLVYNAGFGGKARLRDKYRSANRDELLQHKDAAVHHSIRLREFEDVSPLLSPHAQQDSSSEDEGDDDNSIPDVPTDLVNPTQRETLELLESVITFMCKEFSLRRVGRSNQMVHVKILRNLLIQCLRALVPAITDAANAQDDADPLDDGADGAGQGRKPGDAGGGGGAGGDAPPTAGVRDLQNLMKHRITLLRSWSKGVEMLLTWDLGLTGPYQQTNREHLHEFAKYYTGLKKKINERCNALMHRWRRKAHDIDADDRRLRPRGQNRDEQRRQAELDAQREDIARSLSAFVVDGSNPKTAHHVRLFMEQFGFVPSGPAGGGAVPKASYTDKIRDILMATHNAEQRVRGGRIEGVSPSGSPAVGSPYGARPFSSPLSTTSAAGDGTGLAHDSILHGAKLAEQVLYTVGAQFGNVYRYKAMASIVERGSQRAAKIGCPFPRGTTVVCMAEENGWVQLENGYWMLASDLVRASGTCGEVLQHSADNARMRDIVGARESRQRQQALILNSLMAVVHTYLKITSRDIQEEFVAIARAVASQPLKIEDQAKLERLFNYDSDDGGNDGSPRAAKEAANEQLLKEQHHQVMTDMLLRKYGQGRSHVHKLQQQYLKNQTVWSTSLDAQIKMAFSYRDMLDGEQGDAAQAKPEDDVDVPSVASSDTDDAGSPDEAGLSADEQVVKIVADLNGVLQNLNWDFPLRHETSNRWSALPLVRLKKVAKHWKRGLSHYQAYHMAMQSLVKKLETDPGVINEPAEVTALCQNVVQLAKGLEVVAIKLRQALDEDFMVEGLKVDAYIARETAGLQAAIKGAKDVSAAEAARSYFDTVRGPPAYRAGVGV